MKIMRRSKFYVQFFVLAVVTISAFNNCGQLTSFETLPGLGQSELPSSLPGGVVPPSYIPPEVPPVPSSPGSRQFKLKSSSNLPAPFSTGFAFRKGDVPSGKDLQVNGATAQVQIKNRWSDGSAKFAIVSGAANFASSQELTIGLSVVDSTGAGVQPNITPANLQSVIQAGPNSIAITTSNFGSATWSGADLLTPFQTWVSGPEMSSWIYRKQIGSDPHLVGWLEIRMFRTGDVEFLPWVENGYLLVEGPTSKSATYSFLIGASTRYSQQFDLPHHCRSPLILGTDMSYWLSTQSHNVSVKHDTTYLQSTGLVPSYFAVTPDSAPAVQSLPLQFTKPLFEGSYPPGLGSVGGNNYVGLLPLWDTLYLTNQSYSTYRAVVINGFAAGRYGFHYRDEFTQLPAQLSRHPNLNLRQPEPGWVTTPASSGTSSPAWSIDHQPLAGYMAYLVTGWNYNLQTVQFMASSNALSISSTNRQNGLGIFGSQFAGSARLAAWTWRALALAAAVTPDNETRLKTEYQTQLSNNINYYFDRYVGQPSNPQGFVQPSGSYSLNLNGIILPGATTTRISVLAPGLVYYGSAKDGQYIGFDCTIGNETRKVTGYISATNTLTVSPGFSQAPAAGGTVIMNDHKVWDAPWMQDYVTAVWGWTKDLDVGLSASGQTRLDSLFSWKAKSIVGRFGGTGVSEYLYRDFAPYEIPTAPTDSPDWENGTGPWFTDWGAIYNATYAGTANDNGQPAPYASLGPKVIGDIRSTSFIGGDPQAPAAQALPAIAYAAKHNVSGARVGYQRLLDTGNWQNFVSILNNNPTWAVKPYYSGE